ncbi:hypothetical protein F5884DRAFT_881803, partial [Xylogone sp. PMI_703]
PFPLPSSLILPVSQHRIYRYRTVLATCRTSPARTVQYARLRRTFFSSLHCTIGNTTTTTTIQRYDGITAIIVSPSPTSWLSYRIKRGKGVEQGIRASQRLVTSQLQSPNSNHLHIILLAAREAHSIWACAYGRFRWVALPAATAACPHHLPRATMSQCCANIRPTQFPLLAPFTIQRARARASAPAPKGVDVLTPLCVQSAPTSASRRQSHGRPRSRHGPRVPVEPRLHMCYLAPSNFTCCTALSPRTTGEIQASPSYSQAPPETAQELHSPHFRGHDSKRHRGRC